MNYRDKSGWSSPGDIFDIIILSWDGIIEQVGDKVGGSFDWGKVLPNLDKHQIIALNQAAFIMAGAVATGYTVHPEIGAGVQSVLTIPSLAISVVTTADAWGDYYRMENPTKGQLNRVLANTTITFSGVVFLPLAIPAASFGVLDQNGNFNQYWNSFDEK